MKIAVDVREACSEKRTGKGQWAYGFVSEFLFRGQEMLLLTDAEIPEEWKEFSPTVHTSSPGMLWHHHMASYLKKQDDVNFFLSPTSYIVPSLLPTSVPCIPVVHDLIAFHKEPHDRKAKIVERLTLKKTLRKAKHVLSVSESTKRDLLERYPFVEAMNISVVYAGPMENDPPRNTPDGSTILCAATLSPRKNQQRLIEAFKKLPDALRTKHRLLLAGGRGWHDQQIVDLAEGTPGVEYEGFVSPERYSVLLATCELLALPSLYEGFGMQILDALQRGIPVLTSNRGSLPEVTGECAVLVDPESTEDIAEGLERILTSSEFQEDLRASGPGQASNFSWKRSVDLFLASLKKLQ